MCWLSDRNLFLACEFVGDMEVDGICRFLTPTNVGTLVTKANKTAVGHAEHILTDARNLTDCLQFSPGQKVSMLGALDCKFVLHFCKKTKEVQPTEYKSFDHALASWTTEVSKDVGFKIERGRLPAPTAQSGSAASAQPTQNELGGVETVAEMQSSSFQAKKLGFIAGALVTEKAGELVDI